MVKKDELTQSISAAEFVEARTIAEIGVSFLVEYVSNGEVFRVIVPNPENGKVERDVLDLGVPYGIDWAAILKPAKPTPEDFARALKNADIWTLSDAMTRPNEVISALHAVYGIDLAAVLTAANKIQEV